MKKTSNLSYHEWKGFKKHFGIKNSDVGLVLGIDPKSVQNATAPSYRGAFPLWAKLAIWTWRKCLDRETVLQADIIKLKEELSKKTSS